MKNYILYSLMLISMALISCNTEQNKKSSAKTKFEIPTISNDSIINQILKKDIEVKISNFDKEKAKNLRFLYAYMSLNDRMNYPFSYFSDIVDITMEIKNNLSWTKQIPENIFNHFVLPHRINNESLDSSRRFFYHQLKPRVENMSMLNAALEVNHWCHEHVAYQASDSRTSSALATYHKGYGRCGEESVFTVSALRAVGIPARQVYTPRWAHTDDNHAWVEFWADGKWYFYGACEPVAIPNTGWFTEPARRAMLVVSRVYGPFYNSKHLLYSNSYRSAINTLYVYAPVNNLIIKVTDKNNKLIKNASVEFQIYNYAEFYTLYKAKTNKNGIASFETGKGDLLVWAHTDSSYAYKMIRNNETDTFTIILGNTYDRNKIINVDYHPPIKPEPRPKNQELIDKNSIRLVYEDSLRKSFEDNYIDSITCVSIANNNNIDSKEFWQLTKKSRANWNEIISFIKEAPDNLKSRAMDLLNSISLKDLQDVKSKTLLNHLLYTIPFKEISNISEYNYIKYILNPRISDEDLWPWRHTLRNSLGESLQAMDYYLWVKNNIHINDSMNYSGVQINPVSVFNLKISDKYSRDLLLVSLWRANGIAARLEEGTLLPQYLDKTNWVTVDFIKSKNKEQSYGFLHLEPKNKDSKLLYYKHFTIAKLNNGIYTTLAFPWDKNINDFNDKIKLSTGNYRLCTGNRLAEGSVLVKFTYFTLIKNELRNIVVEKRRNSETNTKYGKLNEIKLFAKGQKKNACTISNETYKILIWYRPNNEPSKHALEDIAKVRATLNKYNTELWLMGEKDYKEKELDPKYFKNILSHTYFYHDNKLEFLQTAQKNIKQQFGNEFPYILLLNTNNEIIYISQGYKIGLGEEVKKAIKRDME